MGHKHSTLHSQLRNQSEGPNCDLVGSTNDAGTSSSSAATPYLNIKHGPFKRKLSVRNISIRRSFHIGKNSLKHHQPLNDVSNYKIGSSATTDHLPSSSSSTNNNSSGLPQQLSNGNGSSMSTNHSHQHHYHNHQTPVLPRSTGKRSNNKEKFVMDRLRKSFRNSFRKKKPDIVTESQKPHQWQSDEHSVRSGTCVFPVKYLGCVEVFDSRGMHICEDALRRLRNSRRRGVKGQLYVTGDGIRVVDDDTKGLIVDQTIEKVSFCAPDRSHERGFSYICRDGTTRRWMCHGFHATKDSGERLSHAVGCAFNICLERKQKRDKESDSAILDANNFTRTGSFRQSSITERLQDPQVAKPAEPVPVKPVHNPYAVARPHATANLLQRQGSLRGGPLNHASPFKRQLSLRLNIDSMTEALKSIETSSLSSSPNNRKIDSDKVSVQSQRNRAQSLDLTAFEDDNLLSSKKTNKNLLNFNQKITLTPSIAPIQEISPSIDKQNSLLSENKTNDDAGSMITAMCQQLSQGLNMLSAKTDDELDIWSSIGHFSPPAALTSATKTSTAVTNNKKDTDLSHLVKDTNSLFTFSNIDQWISNNNNKNNNNNNNSNNCFSEKTSTPNDYENINISQQLNNGSLDSGIASGSSSLSGKSNTVSLIPPAVVDQMPQVTAPPPPLSPSSTVTFCSSSFVSQSQSTTSTMMTSLSISPISLTPMVMTTTSSSNVITLHNDNPNQTLLTNDGTDRSNNNLANNYNPFLEANDWNSNLSVSTSATTTTISEQIIAPCKPFKSTNPFVELSQYMSDKMTTTTAATGTKSFDNFESIFDVVTSSSTPSTTVNTTTNQQMVKAFEVSM